MDTREWTEYPDEYRDIRYMFLSPPEFHQMRQPQENPTVKSFLKKLMSRSASDTVIIYPPTIDWEWMRQRPQQIMQQFARHGYEVYYCNKTQTDSKYLEEIRPNLTIVYDNKTFIKEKIPKLKREGKNILLWISWSKLYLFVEQYSPDWVVFDYVDDIPDWEPYLDRMIHNSNLIVTTAAALQQEIGRRHPDKPCCLIPNGCDLEHFSKYRKAAPAKPEDLRNHNGPIIGFIGAWAHWVDQDLVKQLAAAFPHALFPIIGVEFAAKVDRSVPNFLYLGYKPYDVLPQYLHYFDVCLIPFKLNRITLAANPIKMYEYLASGKPVVATSIPEVKAIPNVFTGNDFETISKHIRHILSPNFRNKAAEVDSWLERQTWESRFIDIQKAITFLLPTKENIG